MFSYEDFTSLAGITDREELMRAAHRFPKKIYGQLSL